MLIWLAGVVIDGFTFNTPTIGLTLGWIVAIWFVVGFLLGRIHTNAAWIAREEDHREAIRAMDKTHEKELERIEHDRQEWRTESRIKDAQLVEKDTQLAEVHKQISALAPLAGTVEQVMLALRELTGRTPT